MPYYGMAICASSQDPCLREKDTLCQARRKIKPFGKRLPFHSSRDMVAIDLGSVSPMRSGAQEEHLTLILESENTIAMTSAPP